MRGNGIPIQVHDTSSSLLDGHPDFQGETKEIFSAFPTVRDQEAVITEAARAPWLSPEHAQASFMWRRNRLGPALRT